MRDGKNGNGVWGEYGSGGLWFGYDTVSTNEDIRSVIDAAQHIDPVLRSGKSKEITSRQTFEISYIPRDIE